MEEKSATSWTRRGRLSGWSTPAASASRLSRRIVVEDPRSSPERPSLEPEAEYFEEFDKNAMKALRALL
jgi:hypothetical protein